MKRFLFFLLIAALLLTGVALAETADFEMEYGLVTDYTGPGGDVVLPAEIDGWPITGLRWGVFNNDDTITSITLPEGLQAIGPNNIFSCRSLTQVNIPATVAFIDYDCFSWNDNLTSITFEGPVPIFGGTGFSVVNPDLVVYVPDDQLEAYRAVIPAEVNVAPSGRNAVIVDQTADEGWFEFDPDTGTITAYYGVHGYLVIPSEIEGVPVKAIANDVFYNDQRLFYAVLPEGLEVIGDNAFRYCNNMYGASLPNSLRVIGEKAFVSSWREPITSWPASLEEIGAGAFGWSGLTGELDFRGCTFAIGEAAFEYTRVQEVYMDDSGVKIAANAFQKSSLNYLCIDAYTMLDGISPDAFAGAERLADLDLPWDCTLENQLAWRAFMAPQAPDCYVWINNPTDCSYPDYDDSTYGENPDGTLYLAAYTGGAESLLLYHTMDGIQITGLGDGVFRGNQTLKKYRVTHSDQFTTIGDEAFADSAVETVDLYYTVETIGAGAFRNCVNLKEITLPASLKSIGAGAFAGCTNLEKVTANCDLSLITEDLFAGCDRLDRAALYGLEKMPYAANPESDFEFDAETGTITGYLGTSADVVIPASIGGMPVRHIGYNAFERCRDYTDTDMYTNQTTWQPLRSVVIPETVTTIADSAFSYCQQLQLVICYAPLASTGRSTFLLCRDLERVIFVNGVGEIDNYAFERCEKLQSVYWGENFRRIGTNAFNRSGLKEIVIDAQIVDEGAFNHSALERVTFTDRVQEIRAGAFSYCEQLRYIACDFCEADRFVDGGPFGGVPQEGVTTIFPETMTPEQLNAMNGKLNVWNGGHLGNGNAITQTPVEYAAAQLPDVDALYQAVLTQPAPEAPVEPEVVVELPDPIADINEVMGAWTLKALVSEGETLDPALFGMTMTLTLNADGTAELAMGDEPAEPLAWRQEDGILYLGDGAEEMIPVGYADGQLTLMEGDGMMVFARGESAAPAETVLPDPIADINEVLGTWTLKALVSEGETLDPTLIGMTMILTLNADGSAELVVGDEPAEPLAWRQDNGILYLGDGTVVTMPIGYVDGQLTLTEDDSVMIFVRGEAAVPAEAALPDPIADMSEVLGAWTLAAVESDGQQIDAAMLGLSMTLTLNEDGTAGMDMAGQHIPMHWLQKDGVLYLGSGTDDDLPVAYIDGQIVIVDHGERMLFVRSGAEAPAGGDAPAAPAPAQTTGDLALEVKYLATTYEAAGYTMDASMLGAEYSITLHADGSCDFIIAANGMPGMRWERTEAGVHFDYMGAVAYDAVLDGTTLKLDFGGMVLNYEQQ